MARYEPDPRVNFTRFDEGEGVLLHLETKSYYTLNATGVFIWEQLDQGRQTIDELVEALLAHYEVTREEAERQVRAFLDALQQEGLVHCRE
ncbi:PqqD family protein [Rhodothermus profundi]|uniref:Coenzyme PQQ synthesis protein D (PqqD) n=1 Tax=Rhodothermus profundi TaxID=633813 RepID=A0A1M6PXF5_9BACT|nr:PqqD family protein [Rhodothermus profundi]SHK12571.1 Coenzyme PQQ synthesis protein D (PqqD) [Rhodothermus profundi]